MQIVVSGREDIQLYRHYPRRDENGAIIRNWYYLQWMTTEIPLVGYRLCCRVGPTTNSDSVMSDMLRVRGYSGRSERSQFTRSPEEAMYIAMKHAAVLYHRFVSDAYGRIACFSLWKNRLDSSFPHNSGVLEQVHADNC